jgi:hypothetical protein
MQRHGIAATVGHLTILKLALLLSVAAGALALGTAAHSALASSSWRPAVQLDGSHQAVASGIAAVTQASAFPSKLIGKWTRKVTAADVKRTGGYGVPAGIVCTLTIKKSGAAHLVCTQVGVLDGRIVPAGTNRVHITLGDTTPNLYGWHVTAHLLTLTKLNDVTPDRAAAMWGIWKRR